MRLNLLACLVALTTATRFELDRAAAQRASEGREQLSRLDLDPESRGCWAAAVDSLKAGCKSMDDFARSRLAVQVRRRSARADRRARARARVSARRAPAHSPRPRRARSQFTNCHLEKSGLATYACTPAMSVAECTRPMVDSPSGLAYGAYTTFYTHAESMCARRPLSTAPLLKRRPPA